MSESDKAPGWVAILAYEAVDELDLSGTLAPLVKAGLETHVIGSGPVRGSSGLLITPDRIFADPYDYATLDALVLPGGKGAGTAALDLALSSFVLGSRSAGVPFYAVCSGALILRDLNLLDGLLVASHGQKKELLMTAGCKMGSGVIRDQWLVSAGGFAPGDGLKSTEVAFRILQDIAPDSVAQVASRMELWPQTSERRVASRQVL